MDVDDAAAELYALPPDEFVAARNAMVKRAKSEGAAQAAAQIKALRKPNLAAWLANQLAREHRSGVNDLVGLGEQMRKATAALDGKRLRELTAQRKDLVDALLRHARQLASNAQQRMSDDVVETLNETLLAAVADPGAADELRAGQLTRGLQHVGFGPVADTGEPAEVISLTDARAARKQRIDRAAPVRERRGETEREEAERVEAEREEAELEQARWAEAERELEQAESEVTAADDHVDDLEADLDERRQRLESAESAVERLAAELAQARDELEQARADLKAGQRDVNQARVEAEQARRRRREAKRQLASLSE